MGLRISKKITKLRDRILLKIKKNNFLIYRLLIFFGAFLKFIYKINKKKSFQKFSSNLDEINKFEYKKTSQNNKDGIIDYIITKLKIKNLNFIEIGFDYFENNSLNLIKNLQEGLFIDGSEEKVFLLKNILKIIYPKKNLKVISSFVDKDNINLLINNNFKKNDEIDFLSIDVDGIDYFLFETLKIRPKVICIEYNFWYGIEEKCSVPYSKNFQWEIGSLYSGASLLGLNDLANFKDYYLIALDSFCVNAFFIR